MEPVFQLDNMPGSAQGFPTENELDSDKGTGIELYKCPFCGLVQLLSEPVSYYKDVIRASGISEEMKAFRREQYRNFIEEFDLQHKKILELGAGCGEYMEIMREVAGDYVYGIEHKPESVDACLRKNLPVFRCYIDQEDIVLANGPFSAFYIMNFLEHVPYPDIFLAGIYHNLEENAVGIVEVPNFDMILQENMYSELISDHLMYFTMDSLRNILEINGFEVLSCNVVWYDYILSAIVRKKGVTKLDDFYKQKDYIYKQIHSYIEDRKRYGKIAVWGAGHQALANLAVLDMKQDISYVIDSAPFKQNKFTPATHIPIVAPDVLCQGEIKTVIIMAGGYSDEIAQIIDTQYKGVEAVILRGNGLEEMK